MMRKIFPLGVCIFFIFCGALFGQPAGEIYKKANLSYEAGNYEEAKSLYERLMKTEKVSPEIFYNLGNTYFKLNKIGKAILNYERALRLAPRDRDIRLNLELARAKIVDKIDIPEKGFVLNMIFSLYERLNIDELTVSVSIIYITIIILFILSIFIVTRRKTFLYLGAALGIFLFVFAIFLFSKIYSENIIESAVVVAEKIDVRSGPKEDYTLQFTLHEGTRLRIIKKRQGWCEIGLSKDLKGWVPKDSVEVI